MLCLALLSSNLHSTLGYSPVWVVRMLKCPSASMKPANQLDWFKDSSHKGLNIILLSLLLYHLISLYKVLILSVLNLPFTKVINLIIPFSLLIVKI